MKTLLLRLAAPLQSWGTESKFDVRKTMREPSKSGVVGLLAAALGRRRDESVEDLCRLRFGVRVDREGELLHDFHMAKKDAKISYVTHRYYLSDAVFLVGLESDDEALLERLSNALQRPAFALFLGRRSCPPTLPLFIGVRNATLENALNAEPLLCETTGNIRIQIESVVTGNSGKIKDIPVSFDPRSRSYTWRGVLTQTLTHKVERPEHDPMAELEG